MEPKRYIRSESASCVHMVEDATNTRRVSDPHERLRALLNAPDDDNEELAPPADAPKFGTVIHNRIFVGGFSLTTTDEDLWKFFSGFAAVTAARVIYDRAGVSKCYGFVTFASPRHARLIVKQSGGVMFSPLGRLRVAQAVRKQMSQLPLLSDCAPSAPASAPLCYQMVCPSPYGPFACGPCGPAPPPYALYPMPFEGAPMYTPVPGPYTLLPAGYTAAPLPGPPCCEPCCSLINQDKAAAAMPLHPAYIY